jgi:DNA-binding transcriptional ArsR family regulator
MNCARTIDLTRALSHPARRRALRRLHAEGRPCSRVELARGSGLEERSVDYHLGLLQLCRITKPIKRAASTSAAALESNVADDPWVRWRLTATEAEDEAAVRPNRRRPHKSI